MDDVMITAIVMPTTSEPTTNNNKNKNTTQTTNRPGNGREMRDRYPRDDPKYVISLSII